MFININKQYIWYKKIDKNILKDSLTKAEQDSKDPEISDQKKYLIDQKIDVLKSLTLN